MYTRLIFNEISKPEMMCLKIGHYCEDVNGEERIIVE